MSKKEEVKLSSPWEQHMTKMAAFLKGDDRFEVCDGTQPGKKKGTVVGCVRVKDADAYLALGTLGLNVKFGNVTLLVDIVPANDDVAAKAARKVKSGAKYDELRAIKTVLKGNPAFDSFKTLRFMDTRKVYGVFKPAVLQWYAGIPGSPWKIITCSYEHVVSDLFANEVGVLWCTKPLAGGAK